MSEKYYIIASDGELYHWKYVKREKVKGKWKYYYDLPGAKKAAKSTVKSIWDKIRSITKKKSSKVSSAGTKVAKKKKTSFFSRLKDKVKDVVSKAKKTVHKYIAKVPVGDTFRYFYSDEAYQAYLNGKNAVDEAGDRKVGTLIDDAVKDAAKNFISNLMNTGFGKAVYNTVLPAFTALQVALTTPKSFDDVKKIDGDQTNDEHQEDINPNYDPDTFDYSYNCSFCTAAYDLRKRGYDVQASPISILEGPVIEDILSWYDGAVAVSEDNVSSNLKGDDRYNDVRIDNPAERVQRRASALNESLESYGDGARGHLAMYWRQGGGHDIAWEVENGKVVYRDCQTNEVYDISTILPYVQDYSYVRVDNCEPTEEVLRTVQNCD